MSAVEQAEPVEGVPCFDPGCPCCSVHTPLHEKYEDQIERLREALEKIKEATSANVSPEKYIHRIARAALGTQEKNDGD